jgi:hypothetical protein
MDTNLGEEHMQGLLVLSLILSSGVIWLLMWQLHKVTAELAYFYGYRRAVQGEKPGCAAHRPKAYERHFDRGMEAGSRDRQSNAPNTGDHGFSEGQTSISPPTDQGINPIPIEDVIIQPLKKRGM